MTSIEEQIAAVTDTIMAGERMRLTMPLSPLTELNQNCLRAVVATLQQHKHAMEALRPFAKLADGYDAADDKRNAIYRRDGFPPGPPRSDGHRVTVSLGECRAARAVLDTPPAQEQKR